MPNPSGVDPRLETSSSLPPLPLFIYFLLRSDDIDYDEHDSCVVIATSPLTARDLSRDLRGPHWRDLEAPSITCTLLGTALPTESSRIVCASFNAG